MRVLITELNQFLSSMRQMVSWRLKNVPSFNGSAHALTLIVLTRIPKSPGGSDGRNTSRFSSVQSRRFQVSNGSWRGCYDSRAVLVDAAANQTYHCWPALLFAPWWTRCGRHWPFVSWSWWNQKRLRFIFCCIVDGIFRKERFFFHSPPSKKWFLKMRISKLLC